MKINIPDLSKEQWDFLSTVCALENPVSLEIAGKLSPILPAPFLELLGKGKKPAMIEEFETGLYRLLPDLSQNIIETLKEYNNAEKLSELLDKLYEMNLIDRMNPKTVSNLLFQTGRTRDIAELEINHARKALNMGDQHLAMQHLWNVVKQLYEISNDPAYESLFISASLKLSDLCFALGKGFMELPIFLKKARTMAKELGDRRSHALINLNLSIFFHIARQHNESLKALSEGLEEVQELGDEDILSR